MKTTVELPDELMRAVKIRAANEGRKLKEVMADVVRRGLSEEADGAGRVPQRVMLPLVECARPASARQEMTPERVAEVLSKEEASIVRNSS